MNFNDSVKIYRDRNLDKAYFLDFNDSTLIRDYGDTTTFLRGTGSLLLRGGLILIQFGCVPCTNVNGVILQNIIDLACATIAYGTLGYMFAFGHDKEGITGWGVWIFAAEADLNIAVLGWSSIIAVTGIYTTMFAGRLHYIGCILITTLLAGIIIPIIMHWVWTSTGWMYKASFIQNLVSYKDHGGGMLIHVCGGIVALIGSIFLGRRLIRLQDIDEGSLTPESPASATVGYLLVIIGLMTGCLTTPIYELTHEPMNYIGLTFFNNILAATGGIITVVLLQLILSRHLLLHYWTMLRYMQGAIAGIVTISSGVDVYTPYVALGLGIFGAIFFYIIAYYMFYSALEDYANIIAIHLACGFLGTLLPPLCGSREGFGVPHKIIIHFAWQVIGDLIVLSLMIISITILFFIIKVFNLLQNEEEVKNHKRAMVVLAKGPDRKYSQRLWGLKHKSHLLQPHCRANKRPYQQELAASVMQGTSQEIPTVVHSSPQIQGFHMQECPNTSDSNKEKDILLSSTTSENK